MSDRTRAGFASVGLVLIGFALGVFADHLWLAHRAGGSAADLTHSERMFEMLHTLELTDVQRATIDSILDRYHDKVEEQLDAVHPKLFATIDSARHEIEAALAPDQLAKFRDWLRAEHLRMRHERYPFIEH